MPISIPVDLPAFDTLRKEGVPVIAEHQAKGQDIRPLRIGLLNLMPKKIEAETQFARLIGATPLQVEMCLIRLPNHEPKNTSKDHMSAFYRSFTDVKHEKFDGLIVTGAPVEHLDFDEVTYLKELHEVFDWSKTNVHSTLAVCWGAMAMVSHLHGIKKHLLKEKAFGCFRHRNFDPTSRFLRGFSDDCLVPTSRWAKIEQSEIEAVQGLKTLMGSKPHGPSVVEDPLNRALYVFEHFEYDSDTLKQEYDRDVQRGRPIKTPQGYFPNDDLSQKPVNRWRSHAHLLFGNWISEVYATTPFNRSYIGRNSVGLAA